MALITYENKVALNENPSIADINKVKASDMNEIKSVVNENNIVGSIIMYGGTTAPTGYLICDGSAINRTTYADLFAAIGTTFGTGDGSTTFNIPNMKGKVSVGYDSTQTEFDTLGETGGEKTHTLTTQEIPAHKHSIAAGTGGSGAWGVTINQSGSTGSDNNAINNTGGGQAHNNLQPYLVVNYIIKY